MINNIDRDSNLFEKIKKGNHTAFNELFSEYYNTLCEFSNYMINNKSLAEEIVADVFANVWINRRKIIINKNLKGYLYNSTRNITITYIRKNKNNTESIEDSFIDISNPDFSSDKNIIKEEKKKLAYNLLKVVPEKSREVFIMNKYNGLRYKDIAALLDVSIKTVEKHMTKSFKLLRENYKEKSKII